MSVSVPRPAPSRLDLVLTALCLALAVLLMVENGADGDGPGHVAWTAVPAFALVAVPLLWRRTEPLLALGGVIVVLGLHAAVYGGLIRCGAAIPILALLAFAASAQRDGRDALVGLGLALAGAFLLSATDFLGMEIIGVALLVPAASWGAGRVARSRGRLNAELRQRHVQLRAARDERARLEVAADRAEISRELDGLLHRRLGELAELAEAGGEGDGAVAVLHRIEEDSRATLDQMRTLVGALRSDEAAVAPQPALTALDALVLRTGGPDARLRVAGSPRALPAGVELTAYRVVEHLLGALEDAPGVEVEVAFGPDSLGLTVSGPARRRTDVASAVARARERIELHRGSLESSTQGGRAQARVALPLAA